MLCTRRCPRIYDRGFGGVSYRKVIQALPENSMSSDQASAVVVLIFRMKMVSNVVKLLFALEIQLSLFMETA